MKKSVIFMALLLCTLVATAQQKTEVVKGNGIISKESRKLEHFTKIVAKGPFEVRLMTGDAGEVSVEADKNIIGLVTTTVENNTLTVAPKEGTLFKSSTGNKVIVRVSAKGIEDLALSGSGTISSKTTIKSDLAISIEGSGDVDIEIESGSANATVSGSGNIKIKGKTQNFTCQVTGSGSILAEGLDASAVNVTISGSGDARVFTKQALTGRIIGSGNVAYAGKPKERDLKRTGTGDFLSL